jgi:hypothetical protein
MSLTTTVFSQRSMRRFGASQRRATPKGQNLHHTGSIAPDRLPTHGRSFTFRTHGDPQGRGHRPGAERTSPTWAAFLRSQAEALLACDFIETVTLTGQRQYILAVIEHATRRVRVLGTEGFYNGHRPHQAIDQAAPLKPRPDNVIDLDSLLGRRQDRAGGILHEYHQVA